MAIYRNQRLFSDYYLQERLPETTFWREVKQEELQKTYDEIKSIYQNQKSGLENLNESQLEERFIRPILRRLGHIYEVNVSLPKTREGLKHPDYTFYDSEEAKKAGISKAIAIGEAKRYGRPLDRKLKTEPDPFEIQNPSLQISRYLWISEAPWGILTDGRFWRLYERETSKRLDIFYEIDLFKIIEEGSLDEFKYFYTFFRKEAFPDFLQKVYDESLEYAKEVGNELKENAYKAIKILTEGFLKTSVNNLTIENIKEVHNNCYIFLYRLLFIFYAEARGLLPLDNKIYKDSYSLNSIKKEIKEKIDKKESVLPISLVYWGRLKTLFELVNKGSQSFGIPQEVMYIPPYNGSLLDPAKHTFLEKYTVSDKWLIEVIDLLARSPSRKNSQEKAFVDYSSLEISHLGSIYEGLLEYRLRIAEKDIIPVKEKGKEVFVSLEEARKGNKRYDEKEIVRAGEVYVVTDKGERKATGSYYTPGYIVDYIIENTLKPLCDRITDKIGDEITDLEEKIKESRGVNRASYQRKINELKISFDDEVFKLKILDPAMGSGHFLVRATDYLAEEIATNPYAWDEEAPEEEESVVFWKRRVVERCIYGVDLNPMAVELAKLSLWLSTVAKDKPLSFLDHHLRCGNSLIGAKLEDLRNLRIIKKKRRKKEEPQTQMKLFDESKFVHDIALTIGDEILIETRPTDTVEQVKEKQEILDTVIEARRTKWKSLADLWIARYFNEDLEKMDRKILQHVADVISGKTMTALPQVKQAIEEVHKLSSNKCFFHWELEFPEVFFDKHGRRKDTPGFDAVVGNPPYLAFHLGTKVEKQFYNILFDTAVGKYDAYVIFTEKAIKNLRVGGRFSFIMPNKFINSQYGIQLKRFISQTTDLYAIVDFGDNQVFEGATNYPCILITEKSNKTRDYNLFYVKILSQPQKAVTLLGDSRFDPKIMEKIIIKKEDAEKWLLIDEARANLMSRLSDKSLYTSLKKITKGIFQGVRIGYQDAYYVSNETIITYKLEKDLIKLAISGEDVDPYENLWEDTHVRPCYLIYPYILYEKLEPINIIKFPKTENYLNRFKDNLAKRRDSGRVFSESGLKWFEYWDACEPMLNKRIVTPDISKKNEFTLVDKKYLSMNTIYSIVLKNESEGKYLFLLSLLNSNLLEFYIKNISPSVRGGYFRYKTKYLEKLPIRRISFTTPKEEREKLVNELKERYQDEKFDEVLKIVEECLPKDKEGDFTTKKEKSDVVHDFLVYLAEQMIEMNKTKHAEIKGFLSWLEREIGAEIENLSNKTAIKDYYEGAIDSLLCALKKNKRKFKIDPTRREIQDKITEEFTKSISKLSPLKQTITATDKLIDQIVYKLYGLTEKEVEIVEKGT